MMALVGTLAYEFQVSLPVMARHTLHAGAEGYGFMTSAMGVGAIVGGLVVAARGRTGLRPVTSAALAFAVALALAALAPNLGVELVALALTGAASVSFMAIGNSTLQLAAEPAMRGRVMALWFVAFQGSTPIGAPGDRGDHRDGGRPHRAGRRRARVPGRGGARRRRRCDIFRDVAVPEVW